MHFSPAIYEHAAALIGERPWTVSRDAGLLARAHGEAFARYGHAPVVVGIDVYDLEPEAYGAVVDEPLGHAIPAIGHHPCGDLSELGQLPQPVWPEAGRWPLVLSAAQTLAAEHPGIDLRVPISGPFSIASNLLGFEPLLMAVYEDGDAVRAALEHLVDGQLALVEAVTAAGLAVTCFESAATPPLLSPDLFRAVEAPALGRLVAGTRDITGTAPALIIGGDTAPIVDDLVATGAGFLICPSETDQDAFVSALAGLALPVRVNMDPAVFCQADRSPALVAADAAARRAERLPAGCVGSGVLPYEALPDTVLAVAVHLGG